MRENLKYSVKVRFTETDYKRLMSVGIEPSKFVRGAVLKQLLVHRL